MVRCLVACRCSDDHRPRSTNSQPSCESRTGHQHTEQSHHANPDYTTTPTPTRTSHRHLHGRRPLLTCISPSIALCALLAASIHPAMAQEGCVSLAESTACSAFSAASISTASELVGLFPFLSNVSDTASFDTGIRAYIGGPFTQLRYGELIGCSNVQSSNATDFYARYTTSVLCNAIVQNSIEACGLSGEATRPLCADSCAEYAHSEQEIAASNICGSAGPNALRQVRADFTNCALPANSITGSCIQAVENQGSDCGFADNLGSLCTYCSASSPNATDSCCLFSDTTERCDNVELPIIASASLAPITVTSTPTGSPSATGQNGNHNENNGLSGGQIAGIVVGSVLGALLLLALIIAGCLLMKRRRDSSPATSIFNQPSPSRKHQEMDLNDGARDHQERAGLAILPGGRVARMSALEGESSSSHRGAYGLGAYAKDISEGEEDMPEAGAAPLSKRSGSLSSGDQLGIGGVPVQDMSPSSGAEYTSPESQGQSEQLNFFKDYYSQDEIRAGDLVSTLWAYEPRAADEFQLERGDMIKVLGIWDDGWATGVRVRQRAEDWTDPKVQRDSGLSSATTTKGDDTADEGEVKAFPLVCVCMPQHWKKTIEGDSTEGSGPGTFPDRG